MRSPSLPKPAGFPNSACGQLDGVSRPSPPCTRQRADPAKRRTADSSRRTAWRTRGPPCSWLEFSYAVPCGTGDALRFPLQVARPCARHARRNGPSRTRSAHDAYSTAPCEALHGDLTDDRASRHGHANRRRQRQTIAAKRLTDARAPACTRFPAPRPTDGRAIRTRVWNRPNGWQGAIRARQQRGDAHVFRVSPRQTREYRAALPRKRAPLCIVLRVWFV